MPRCKKFCEEEVLQKAIELFWIKGYCNTSMQDLVSHLGINRASMYDTYGDKHSLLIQALKVYKSGVVRDTRNFMQTQSSVKDGLYALLKNSTGYNAHNKTRGCFIVNVSSEIGANDPAVFEIIDQNRRDMEGLLCDFIQKGINDGELPSTLIPADVAAYLHTFMAGLIIKSKMIETTAELDKIIHVALEGVLTV